MIFKTKHIDEIYSLIVLLASLIAWLFTTYGIVIMCVGLLLSLLLKDFKYTIPWLLNFVFTINIDLSLNVEINPMLYVVCLASVIILIVSLLIKKINIKIGKSKLIYLLMSVVTLIPIFWTRASENSHLFLYFSWLLYTLIYLYSLYSNDRDNEEILASSMINLGLLIAFEVIIVSVKTNGFDMDKILSSSGRVGWGIFNECGIMMLTVIPYIFYSFHKKNFYIVNLIKLLIIILACFFTNSRGTYIFGIILLISLIILLVALTKKTKGFYLSMIALTVGIVLFGIIFHGKIIEVTNIVLDKVFHNGLSNNGRFRLYEYGISSILSKSHYMLLGPGFVSSYYGDLGKEYVDMGNIFLVYHSSVIQTLAVGGVVGFIIFIIFIAKRYIFIKDNWNNDLYKFILIGLIPIELYGLIDNTYHMFYFMIPLAIMMGVLESSEEIKFERMKIDVSFFDFSRR